MNFEHHSSVPVARPLLWDLLLDVERVAKCFPGAKEVVPNDDGSYSGSLRVRVGPVSLGINGNLTILEADREAWQALLQVEGADRRVGGSVRGRLTMRLNDISAEETELSLSSDLTFMGKLGEMGQPLIRKKAETTMEEFTRNLAAEAARG